MPLRVTGVGRGKPSCTFVNHVLALHESHRPLTGLYPLESRGSEGLWGKKISSVELRYFAWTRELFRLMQSYAPYMRIFIGVEPCSSSMRGNRCAFG
jgi:hypothetical protein